VSETVTVTPGDRPPWSEVAMPGEALEVPGLGLCYPVLPHVAAVKPDSAAARAGIKPGDVVNSISFTPIRPQEPASTGKEAKDQAIAPRPVAITVDESPPAWVRAFYVLQERPEDLISLEVNKGSRAIELKPEPTPGWYFPSRGLVFLTMLQKLPPQDIASALRRGWDDTVENILSIYGTIKGLIVGRLGPRGVAGPITIVQVAYSQASQSFTDLIHFLGILSINLAVINFLPIPPLDGGQMLFLLAEKIRGRPLPESALSAGILVGIVLVLALMVFVLFQDAVRLIERLKGF
jgi:regulator of sigma E protease